MKEHVKIAIDFGRLSNFLSIFPFRQEDKKKVFPFSISLTIDSVKRTLTFYNVNLLDENNDIIKPDVDILIGVKEPYLSDQYSNLSKYRVLRPLFTKTEQVHLLNSRARELNIQNYYFIQASNYKSNLEFNSKILLIKPEVGAEGIDHFVINTNELNLKQTLNRLLTFKDESQFCSFLKENDGAITYYSSLGLEPKENTHPLLRNVKRRSCFASFLNNLKPDFSIQEIVQDIKKEYRVIIDKDKKPVFFVPRKRDSFTHYSQKKINFDYKQGHSEELLQNDPNIRFDVVEDKVFNELSDLEDFKQLLNSEFISGVSSLDLFVCEDGRWGIFEFNPQFSCIVYPTDFKFKLHLHYILDLVREYLK